MEKYGWKVPSIKEVHFPLPSIKSNHERTTYFISRRQ